ncbi:hypothetical protein AOLI_G00119010 [Acnodon oligacanthus]
MRARGGGVVEGGCAGVDSTLSRILQSLAAIVSAPIPQALMSHWGRQTACHTETGRPAALVGGGVEEGVGLDGPLRQPADNQERVAMPCENPCELMQQVNDIRESTARGRNRRLRSVAEMKTRVCSLDTG